MSKDTDLLARIKTAVAGDAAKQNVTTLQAELVSRIWLTLMARLRGEFSLGRREFRTTREFRTLKCAKSKQIRAIPGVLAGPAMGV